MVQDDLRSWVLLAGALGLLLLPALFLKKTRSSWLNGLRCASTQPLIWKLPVFFALIHGAYQFIVNSFLLWHMQENWRPELDFPSEFILPDLPALVLSALPSTVESLAASVNSLGTFPLSSLFAALFLVNFRGYTGLLFKQLRKRFGVFGWLLFFLGITSSFCALLKAPSLFLLPYWINHDIGLSPETGLSIINSGGFIFEYFVGVVFQVFLVLYAYSWVRGLYFPPMRLFPFTLRRLGVVMRWGLVVVALSLTCVAIPLGLETIWGGGRAEGTVAFLVDQAMRPLIAVIMLILAAVQLHLILHNDSLKGGILASLRFLRANAALIFAFFLSAMSSLLACFILTYVVLSQQDSLWMDLAGIGMDGVCAAMGGWILASWVCLYKSVSYGTKEIVF